MDKWGMIEKPVLLNPNEIMDLSNSHEWLTNPKGKKHGFYRVQ